MDFFVNYPHIRLSRVRSLDIDLPVCNKEDCEDHLKGEWRIVLDEICNHLGSNLEEMVIIGLAVCDADWSYSPWIDEFASAKRDEQGITSCVELAEWADGDPDNNIFLYHWAPATPESSLVNLMARTVRGGSPDIGIFGSQDAALSLPTNVFEVLSNLAEDGMFYLRTNIKIKFLDLNHLKNCRRLGLFNRAAIDDEEVEAMEGILAQVAIHPRPKNPGYINLPKVKPQCNVLISLMKHFCLILFLILP